MIISIGFLILLKILFLPTVFLHQILRNRSLSAPAFCKILTSQNQPPFNSLIQWAIALAPSLKYKMVAIIFAPIAPYQLPEDEHVLPLLPKPLPWRSKLLQTEPKSWC